MKEYLTNEERVKRYKKLRKVGFTSREASHFKNLRLDKVERIISIQEEANEQIKQVLAERGAR